MMEGTNSYQNMPTITVDDEDGVGVSMGGPAPEAAEATTTESEGANFWQEAGEKVKRASMSVRDSVSSATSNMVAKVQDMMKSDPDVSAEDMEGIRAASSQFGEQPQESQLSGVMRRVSASVSSAASAASANAQVGLEEGIRRASAVAVVASAKAEEGLKVGAANVEKAYKSIGDTPAEVNAFGKLENIKGQETDYMVTTIFPAAVGLFSLISFVFGILAMASTASAVVDLANYCLFILAFLTLYQKMQLEHLGDFRLQQDKLRDTCNDMARQNNTLTQTLQHLDNQAQELSKIQTKMDELAEASGTSVERLSELVEENEELQDEVIEALEKQVIQNIVAAIIRSDRDKDFCVGEDERHILFGRLRSLKGVNFNYDNFMKLVDKDEGDLTVVDVLQMIRQMKDDTVPKEDSIFSFDTRSLL